MMEDNVMSIKYIEKTFNGTGIFTSVEKISDNWNPDADYGNEYVRVHFRIDTPTFDGCDGFFKSNEDRDNWNNEADNLIKSLGILQDSGFKVENSKEKQAYLYAHPQDISGVIRKNDVKRVAEAIDSMELSSIRWVDLFETVHVISDEEYEEYLNGKREAIRKELFTAAATTRTTKYYRAFDIARNLADKFRLNRLGLNDGKNYGGGQTIDYILNVANEMIDEGYLKFFEQNGEKYIRSLNKTEQKQMKIKFA